MNVLIGCESSGVVREAFRRRGHNAWSNDLQPADDGSRRHLQCSIEDALEAAAWDLLIVHLPCTYFCNSGVWAFSRTPANPGRGRLYGAARVEAFEAALALWQRVAGSSIPRIAMENPIPHGLARAAIGRPTQTVQPYQFGDDASKRTCLWLKGLPRLVVPARGRWIAPRLVDGRPRWGNQTDSGQNKLAPSADRWKLRSRTYPGIAQAMADQWGGGVAASALPLFAGLEVAS